jgi:hypothetical protein
MAKYPSDGLIEPRDALTKDEVVIVPRRRKTGLTYREISEKLPGRTAATIRAEYTALPATEKQIELPAEMMPQEQQPWSKQEDDEIIEAGSLDSLRGEGLEKVARQTGRQISEVLQRSKFLLALNALKDEDVLLARLQMNDPEQAQRWYMAFLQDQAEEEYAQKLAMELYQRAHPGDGEDSEGVQALKANLSRTTRSSMASHHESHA